MVIGLAIGEESRAYPVALLSLHKVVNDTVGGQSVLVTWCPLCFSAIVFDQVVELAARIESVQPGFVDPYDGVRRFEQRFPETAVHLPHFLPGYDHSPAAALAILEFLDQHFAVNPAMKQAILTLIEEDS